MVKVIRSGKGNEPNPELATLLSTGEWTIISAVYCGGTSIEYVLKHITMYM